MTRLTEKEKRERERRFEKQQNDFDFTANQNRARSVTIGTAFGGSTEIMMRKNDGTVVWAILQPVEVVELIHQLSANIGCHIAMKPRDDFSSWREWAIQPHMISGNRHPPFVSDLSPHEKRGRLLPKPEHQPGLQPAMMAKSESNEQTVTTKKTVNRRNTKQAAANFENILKDDRDNDKTKKEYQNRLNEDM